jgi:NAD(P)-dependent dehydrogenase (short-subunit alcohol dehydrogenase family)
MKTPVVIVTGASRGLGEAAARLAAEMGAVVVLNARSTERLDRVAGQIQAAGGSALALPGDVSQPDDCQRIVERTIAHFERLDALVNNAGVLEPIAEFADADPDTWARNLAVNLFGAMNLTRAALPHLRAARGRVVHVSSGAALNPIPGWSAYCTAKAALHQFSRVLALEEPEVASISLRPGVVDTEMQALIREQGADGMPAESHARFVRLHTAGELLPPEAPGRALALLALYAPHEWSGEFIQWDDERIESLAVLNRGVKNGG